MKKVDVFLNGSKVNKNELEFPDWANENMIKATLYLLMGGMAGFDVMAVNTIKESNLKNGWKAMLGVPFVVKAYKEVMAIAQIKNLVFVKEEEKTCEEETETES